ncbi:MAG: AAA family ATPase [Mariprofundaceae bacterium]|nr:AAA family ATPase [Mariprofundaceae bacterium]
MRNFTEIQKILGTPPAIKKIYLIGCTGAGKTSLVQHILGSKKHSFPVTAHRRTTVAPTEYVIQKSRPFKTTIILKKKRDMEIAIEELIQGAILKAKQDHSTLEDIVYELEQSPDERFKLNQMVTSKTFQKIANGITNDILPRLENKNTNDETLLSEPFIKEAIDKVVTEILAEIESNFQKVCDNNHQLFSDDPIIIENFDDKDSFIIETKRLLSHDFGSISILAEYIRMEGDLLADWLNPPLDFLLIDGEGIGHSLGEKRDTLSARHYDYFNYCNNIVLIDDASDPFAGGGHGAIEGIFLNGYQNKFRLVFSKTDKLEQADQNAYFRRNLNNLRSALKKEQIKFGVENKDTYKFSALNKKITAEPKKAIKNLFKSIFEAKDEDKVPLEYDFDLLFSNFNPHELTNGIKERIEGEHWTVVKALSRRLLNIEMEYKYLKPVSWILTLIMHEVNAFLRKDDLSSAILDSQNNIKQNFSHKLLEYIVINFIFEKKHLWQQAYEKKGIGSHRLRKNFIFGQILNTFLPSKTKEEAFQKFNHDIKQLLLNAGALELKTAIKTQITHVSIKKVFGFKDLEWDLGDDTSILIGKNGSGKSTILKLIYACINHDQETLESFGSPYVELTIKKTFDNGDTQRSSVSHSKSSNNIKTVMVNTFDIKTDKNHDDVIDLDSQLLQLVARFGEFQRGLVQEINKKVGTKKEERDLAIKNLASAGDKEFEDLKRLTTEINNFTAEVNTPLDEFVKIMQGYFGSTNKTLIIDNADSPLMVKVNHGDKPQLIKITQLSSGEKQLLIIFLTVVLERGKSFILLMDEPETSLHVEWQSKFIDDIKKLNANIQIIIATHNPLILLNRGQDEIGIIEANNETVQKRSIGTKYQDISSILLEHFNLSSLIGTQMQKDIKDFTALKWRESELNEDEQIELSRIGELLENSLAGDIIYNKKYFEFLKFLKKNKKVALEDYEKASDEEMSQFLNDFGDSFND